MMSFSTMQRTPRINMKMEDPIVIFGKWAEEGKDLGMERGHANSVKEMLEFACKERADLKQKFSFLDVGCGNGWVVRDIGENKLCERAVGIDGAQQMIANAESRDKKNEYIQIDIDSYTPFKRFDLIHSMEVFYYLKNPSRTIKRICDNWLNPNGRLIIGIDRYYENFQSHSWEEKVGTPMHLMKEQEWKAILEKSGFFGVKTWRVNSSKDWKGTLVITGKTK